MIYYAKEFEPDYELISAFAVQKFWIFLTGNISCNITPKELRL